MRQRDAAPRTRLAGVFAPPALAASVADRFVDAVAGAHAGLLVAAVALHVSAQLCRGLAWHGVLSAPWPGVTRRRACAWHVCGSGLSGVLSTRGGDAARIALARRDLRGATWPALAGTLCAEGSFETVFGLAVALLAVRLGVGTVHPPPPALVGAVAFAALVLLSLAARSDRGRCLLREVGRGLAVLREPRRWASRVLPWQVASRALRLGAATCFLLAFDLPVAPAVVLAACAAQGSGGVVPLPGAGPATIAAALLVALPVAAGHPVDPAAVAALAVVWPAALTAVGVTLSTVLLAALSGARTPRGLLRAARSLRARPAPAPAAP
jgi:Lysylphosphatidylglycerol synthase TM region